MKLKLWQVDAFAERVFEGNPAAIVPLESWLDDARMQRIANENNLAETAFLVGKGDGRYGLRWFTPSTEVDLCGHATLASAWLVFAELDRKLAVVDFDTRSGTLTVERGEDGRHRMSLPSDIVEPIEDAEAWAQRIGEALGTSAPVELHASRNILALFADPAEVRAIKGPGEIAKLIPGDKGLIATAKGDRGFDFISRYFAPHHGVPEDSVTGSAHCALAPFWARRLGKQTMRARQESARGGELVCTDAGPRTVLSGNCAPYLRGEIEV
jgi:predicted PhzF superfamily epimerase YddE/YHI9